MLEVIVKEKDYISKDWGDGVIRMSEDGRCVMVVVGDYNGNYRVVQLKNEDDPKSIFFAHDASGIGKNYWIDRCPIVVDDAKLIIGGNSGD